MTSTAVVVTEGQVYHAAQGGYNILIYIDISWNMERAVSVTTLIL